MHRVQPSHDDAGDDDDDDNDDEDDDDGRCHIPFAHGPAFSFFNLDVKFSYFASNKLKKGVFAVNLPTRSMKNNRTEQSKIEQLKIYQFILLIST